MPALRTLSIVPLLLCPALAQWHQASPSTTPPARSRLAMAFHAGTGETIVFGGQQSPGFGYLGDTWAFDGSDWTQRLPAAAPTARGGATLVADTQRSVLVLYGGLSPSPIGGPSIDETWEWNGATWTQVTTASTPGGRGRHGAAYDAARGRVVVYGGTPSSLVLGASNGTFEYDGVNWTSVTTAGNPGPLLDPAMCYSATLGKVVLFGGNNPLGGGPIGQTWTFDGTTWSQPVVVGQSPQPRFDARMVYDATRSVCVLHGGIDAGGNTLGDTWEFDGVFWTQVGGSTPGPRRGAGFTFDAGRSTSVFFGGLDFAGQGATGTWQYGSLFEAFGAGCAGSQGVPQLAAAAGPRAGGVFQSTIGNLIPAAPIAVMATGFSDQLWAGVVPLPFDLTASGLTGCTLYLDPEIIEVIPAAGGLGTSSLTIPADPIFVGVEFFQQGFSFEFPGWNPFGGVLSNAARCVIGR